MLERFARLFSGYENVYGQYSVDNAIVTDKGKLDGSAWTNRGSPEWKKHLEGKLGLGIIPLKIDNTVLFGAIDVDIYKGLDHVQIERKINSLGLPLVVCRSKSGGAHLYVFFKEPAKASNVIAQLNEWASVLGFGGSEIFPKQKERLSPNDIGNWINLPYFGGNLSPRFAYGDGKKLTLEEFVDFAEKKSIFPSQFKAIDVTIFETPPPELEELYRGAPPCMCRAAAEGGFAEGTRNDSMFNTGVFCRKKFPDDWQEKLREFNQKLCKPPLDDFNIERLIGSLDKKETYEMRCNGPFCNKKKCRQVTFGRGPIYSEVGIDVGSVTKVEGDQAAWYLEINERRVKMATRDLMSQGRFNERCVEMINIVTTGVPYARWLEFIQTAILAKADIVQLPREATWDGMFWQRFTQFSNAMGMKAEQLPDILIGKVYTQQDDILFLPINLFEFLVEVRFKYDSPEQIWAALLDRKVKRDTVKIHNSEVEVWRIKKPQEVKPQVSVTLEKEEF